jgi:hypothetical protein
MSIDFLQKFKLISSSNFNYTGGVIIKIIGDLIFQKRGGLNLEMVAESLRCDFEQLISKLEIVFPYVVPITENLVENPEFQAMFK